MYLHNVVKEIDDALPRPPFARENGSLLMLAGLPGAGKSSIVAGLLKKLPALVVSTDNVRTLLRSQPTYTAAERMLVYEVCYAVIELRLREGQRVIFDGSNYLAARRARLRQLAWRVGAPLAVCYVQASQKVVQERLQKRNSGERRPGDLSDADWAVYKWMVEAQEPIVGHHLILDTTNSSPDELADQLYDYWLNEEAKAASDLNLQSPSWARQLGRAVDSGG